MACLNEAMGKGRKTLVLVIAKLRKKYTLKALLNYTKLAKSTYYDALKKLSREDKYKGLKTLIHNICNKNHGRYGYRRVTMQLHKQGIKINHKVVMRLMKEENLTCKVRAKKYKSYRGQEGKKWDYVITVCGGANESCPMFTGEVKNRLHIGFDDPSEATGSPEFIDNEFHRVRDEIKARFYDFYLNELKPQLN